MNSFRACLSFILQFCYGSFLWPSPRLAPLSKAKPLAFSFGPVIKMLIWRCQTPLLKPQLAKKWPIINSKNKI